ncbi:MAG: hypothetical protein J6S84_01050 [Bacteroidales bacterium]|nr:hypothetical protein [Bacteroidales bacterium]
MKAYYILAGVSVVVLLVILSLSNVENVGIWVIVAIAVWAGVLYFLQTRKSISILENNICSKLSEDGYHWEKNEGQLSVMRDNRKYDLFIWDTSDTSIKRVYFANRFSMKHIESVHWVGFEVLQNSVNRACPHTTLIQVGENDFCCRFETAVCDASNFMSEFETASKLISETLDYTNKTYEKIMADFPIREENNRIGFVVNENVSSKNEK